MHPLFTDPPMQQPGQMIQPQMPGSSLAAALSRPTQMPQLQSPVPQIPLSSMMALKQMMGTPTTGAASGDPGLIWNPNNPIGTQSLGGETANQGSWLGNATAAAPGWLGRMFGGQS